MENERTKGKWRASIGARESQAKRQDLGFARVNSNTSGCSVAVPVSAHLKWKCTLRFQRRRLCISAAAAAAAGPVLPTTRATLLFHNSLRHVSMAPSWVSPSPSHPAPTLYSPWNTCMSSRLSFVTESLRRSNFSNAKSIALPLPACRGTRK